MLAQKCTGAFIICHNMSIKGARKRPDMRILCRIARGSEASRNPLESLQRRTEAGGIARGSEASRNPSESLQRRTEAGRIARGSEASRNPLESLQRRTEAGGDCERERSEPQSRPITRQMMFLGLYGIRNPVLTNSPGVFII